MNSVTKQLTGNPHLPFEVLRVFTDSKVLWAVNYSTPSCVLEELSGDSDWGVRQLVAINPRTPVHVIEQLSKDRNWSVRSAVQARRIATARVHGSVDK